MSQKSLMSVLVGCALVVIAAAAWSRGDDDDDALEMRAPRPVAPKAAFRHAARGAMGATPGGAKDIEYARQRIHDGEVPHESTFTAEGLLSQYDLPLPSSGRCSQILCLSAAAARSDLIAQPDVRYLAQLGFASNLDARTWRREPLNLVAVVDKSGSMQGQPLDTVKRSLQQIVSQMTLRDQLAIVLYGDRSHVHLSPTPLAQRSAVLAAIAAIQSAGSTAMEEGLRVGFAVAGQSKPRFKGVTRLMLFTDERPNVGATDEDSFMGMAREGSRRGIGMTTVGVGTHFGAELATAVSSVRGGNLVFFPDVNEMTRRFQRDFDTLVTELAHDMKLVVQPAPGYQLVGLYGLPGDLVKRTPAGGLEMTIETIFLSRDEGGIFFGFAPAGGGSLPAAPGPLASVELVYVDTGNQRRSDRASFELVPPERVPLGLARGMLLVDEITTLKRASLLHGQQNKTEEAYRLVRALSKKFRDSRVTGLDKERELVAVAHRTLTKLSGHQGEPSRSAVRNLVSGLP